MIHKGTVGGETIREHTNLKKRILYVIPSVSAGGIESMVVALIESMGSERFEFELAVFNPNQPIHQARLEKLGAKVHFISTAGCGSSLISKITWRIKAVWNYSLLIFRNQYEVVHCHNYNSFRFYILLAALRRIPMRIVHSHNAGGLNERDIKHLERRIRSFFRFEWLITHKVGCSQMAVDWLYGPDSNSQVIYNGIDIEKYSVGNLDKKTIREKLKFADGVQLVSVGRFNTQKNQIFLIEVFHEMTKLQDDIYLTLMGFGPLETGLREKVVGLGLNNKVTFLPFDTNVPELLSAVDFFLLPSLWEGLPVTAIESQCARVPIFISDAVTKEVDMGLAVYFSLDKGDKYWAEQIVNAIRVKKYTQQINDDRVKLFDIQNVAIQFDHLYYDL